jgi:hypothetical protein
VSKPLDHRGDRSGRDHEPLSRAVRDVTHSEFSTCLSKVAGPWRTFLRNHAPDITAMDLFVAPTIGFDLLNADVIVRLDRRDLVWPTVTANPAAE